MHDDFANLRCHEPQFATLRATRSWAPFWRLCTCLLLVVLAFGSGVIAQKNCRAVQKLTGGTDYQAAPACKACFCGCDAGGACDCGK